MVSHIFTDDLQQTPQQQSMLHLFPQSQQQQLPMFPTPLNFGSQQQQKPIFEFSGQQQTAKSMEFNTGTENSAQTINQQQSQEPQQQIISERMGQKFGRILQNMIANQLQIQQLVEIFLNL